MRGISEIPIDANVHRRVKDWIKETDLPNSGGNAINCIPGHPGGQCHDLLVTVCAGRSDFELRTMETIALCIDCHAILKIGIIATSYWSEDVFNEWRRPVFQALRKQFGVTFFLFAPHGGKWQFSPLVP